MDAADARAVQDLLASDDDELVGESEVAQLFPSIHTLFQTYNQQYFEGYLDGCVLEWSARMTLCAGICYQRRKAGVSTCTIRLSKPLLQLRPVEDTVNTLLHEMIHAYIFCKFGGTLHRDGHGPDFLAAMNRINRAANTNITVYHTFHAEVKACRVHVWRCQGPCRERVPFYGWCRRSMNRPPQPADWWFVGHQRSCGGTYIKVDGPPAATKKVSSAPTKLTKGTLSSPQKEISSYFKKLGKGNKLGGDEAGQMKSPLPLFRPLIPLAKVCKIDDTPNEDGITLLTPVDHSQCCTKSTVKETSHEDDGCFPRMKRKNIPEIIDLTDD